MKLRKETFYLLLSLISLLGLIEVLLSTKWGAGISPDTLSYISTARNLKNGLWFYELNSNGSFTPLTHFPPFFSIVLAIVSFVTNKDPVNISQIVNAIIFGGIIFISGILLYKLSKSFTYGLLGSLLALFAFPIIMDSSMIWSEPLFILLLLGGILSLLFFLEKQNLIYLIATSLLFSFAILTRYAGLILIPLLLIVLVIFDNVNLKKKIKEISIALLITILPISSYLLRNYLLTGNFTDRSYASHIIDFGTIKDGFKTIATFFIPSTLPLIIFYILLIPLFIFIIIKLKSYFKNKGRLKETFILLVNENKGFILLVIFVLFYLIFLVVSISFFDKYTPLDERILSPILIPLEFVGIILIEKLSKNNQIVMFLLSFYLVIFFGATTFYYISLSFQNGQEYSNPKWDNSPILQTIANIVDSIPLYSNDQELIYLRTGKVTTSVPEAYTIDGTLDPSYQSSINKIKNFMKNNETLIIYINDSLTSYRFPNKNKLINDLNLSAYLTKPDGVIFQKKVSY